MKAESYSIIMAGGKGTRFWPLSRSRRPKQLLRIAGPRSLIRETISRVLPLAGAERTFVVTVAEQFPQLRKELAWLPRRNFLVEPSGRNTAPCIGLAALEVVRRNPAALMIILPADHWISDRSAFRATLRTAVQLAASHDALVTIGVRPTYPETGYGYIVAGKHFKPDGKAGYFRVDKFREKPSLAEARQLIRRGSLWNSGIFIWRAQTLLTLMNRYQPAISRGLEKIAKAAGGKTLAGVDAALRSAIAREYKKIPSLSIDHAILEPAGSQGKVLSLEANFDWNDVGGWAAIYRMLPKDQNGNAGTGKWFSLDSAGCLIHGRDRLMALLGVRGLLIVDTPDALLVANLDRSQQVRELVDEPKRAGYESYTQQ